MSEIEPMNPGRVTRLDRVVDYLRGQSEPVAARTVAEALGFAHAETCTLLTRGVAAARVIRSGTRNAYRYALPKA
jgi:hypothetical protein